MPIMGPRDGDFWTFSPPGRYKFAMDIALGSITAQIERPQNLKFAWPIVVIPELFATRRHLAVLTGYLASIGWEVCAIDRPSAAKVVLGGAFLYQADIIEGAIAALDRDAIVLGHGLGGLLALKLAERRRVKAAVAIAPLVPGVPSPLFTRKRRMLGLGRESFGPPTGKLLFDLVADADPFQREAIIKAFTAEDMNSAIEAARGAIDFLPAAAPRLIVSGDSDVFAPQTAAAAFAERIGAHLATLKGRGHWLIGGRALERAIAEIQRFLVRALGQELLLLYPDQSDKDDDSEAEG
jgi:pimeloyl-ACP methyl ester carboxylesterase